MPDPVISDFLANDGYSWKYRTIAGDAKPHGSVVVLHGIQSHGGWYLGSAQWLAERGWYVALIDRRGSGLNEMARGDAPSFRRLLDDIAEFLPTLPKPTFLVGISWGGKLAIALERRHPGVCDGLVLIAPGIKPRVKPPLFTRLRIAASRFIRPDRKFKIPLNEPSLFTANPIQQQFIANDALSLREASARLMVESARLDFYLQMCPKFALLPTLWLLAESDRVIHNQRTRRYASRFRGPATILEYPNAHHTLEFEPTGPPFLSDLERWLIEIKRDRKADQSGT